MSKKSDRVGTPLHLSKHARTRIRQRGLKEADMELIRRTGTSIGDDCIVLLEKDSQREIAKRKQEIEDIQRLCGCVVILAESTVVTTYRSSPQRLRSRLRWDEARGEI